MDRVEGPQRRLGERPRAGEQTAVERPQRDRIDQLASAFQQQVEREHGVVCDRAAHRARDLGQNQLAADQIRTREICARCFYAAKR